MTPAWVVPTARATPWWPLAATAGCLVVAAVPVAAGASWPVDALPVVAAALAAAAVAGLRDPAADLLSAVPVAIATRRAHRLAVLVPAVGALWVGWLALGHAAAAAVAWPVSGLAALLVAGLAVAVWVPSYAAPAAGAVVPLGWVVAARAGGLTWDAHAGGVLVAAGVLLWIGRNR